MDLEKPIHDVVFICANAMPCAELYICAYQITTHDNIITSAIMNIVYYARA